MTPAEARALVAPAVGLGQTWADLGAGEGIFAAALCDLVGPTGAVHALERDPSALAALRDAARRQPGVLHVHAGDLTHSLHLPPLDGILLANVLHFSADAAEVLAHVAFALRAGGALLVIEYEGREPSPWVPHPLPIEALAEAAARAGLSTPREIGRRPSRYRGEMYAALLDTNPLPHPK